MFFNRHVENTGHLKTLESKKCVSYENKLILACMEGSDIEKNQVFEYVKVATEFGSEVLSTFAVDITISNVFKEQLEILHELGKFFCL